MAGFGDAFVNAYNSAQANNRAEQAAQQQAILFAQAQQDRDEKRANLQKLRDAASDQYKPKSKDVQTYDDPGNATADPTSQIGLGDPGIGVQNQTPPTPSPAADPTPSPAADPTSQIGLGDPGIGVQKQAFPTPAAPAQPTPSDAMATPPGQISPTSAPQAPATPFNGQRVPVKVNGEVKYVDPKDAEKINNTDRLTNIATELYKQGDVQGAAQAEENSQRIQSGQIELDRAKALQGLQQAYSLTGQAALDARDQQIAAMPGGHQTKSTLNPDGSITTHDFLNGNLVGTDTVKPDEKNNIPAMTILQNRDLATAGDPNKFQDYVTNLSAINAHGVANAHTMHEDAIADQKLPGELADTQANIAYKKALAWAALHPQSGSSTKQDGWTVSNVKDGDGNVTTQREKDGVVQVTQPGFDDWIDKRDAVNLPIMKQEADKRGLVLGINHQFNRVVYTNPKTGQFSLSPDAPGLVSAPANAAALSTTRTGGILNRPPTKRAPGIQNSKLAQGLGAFGNAIASATEGLSGLRN